MQFLTGSSTRINIQERKYRRSRARTWYHRRNSSSLGAERLERADEDRAALDGLPSQVELLEQPMLGEAHEVHGRVGCDACRGDAAPDQLTQGLA